MHPILTYIHTYIHNNNNSQCHIIETHKHHKSPTAKQELECEKVKQIDFHT